MSSDGQREGVEVARSFLFVPGDRPDRFAKAQASGADLVILDLEDAVPAAAKETALRSVLEWAQAHDRCLVRINGVGTPWIGSELRALRGTGIAVMLPKAERVEDVRRVVDDVAGCLVALIETPRGLLEAQTLAESGAVTRLALGNVDLAACLGVDPASRSALAPARWSLVVASAVAGLAPPVDGVTTALEDPSALKGDVAHARELGFAGRLCIHPRQVQPTNLGMGPSAQEVAWAQRVLAGAQDDGARVVDGAMVDAPVVARARRIVASTAGMEGV
ncbi:HpcH/HpaI aldolase/citrate lyase family protein [Pedococcus sp. 5OH_020]|uniref:HpcH/HpaI aldolase/citrate lyase family protein n=1 Tax=Pedococcus sp. 5OH_020 TaxID=2989814 RepID=UPI0022E9F9E5|nr:CoA ester lyase [Pedococcus sp. 5OH_020]